MKTPHEVSIFGMPLGLPLETLQEGGGTLVFEIQPGKELKKFLALAEVKVVVKKTAETDRQKEILVCGSPPGFRIARLLPQLGIESSTRHFVPKPDLSQELWTCGDFSLRNVKCKEELFSEITHGQHSLCVIEHQNIVVQAAMREYLTQQEKADRSGKPFSFNFQKTRLDLNAFDLLPDLVKLSPGTLFVITCHGRGSGVSREDRVRYAKFKQVIKVMGWADSIQNKKYLLNLIRKTYGIS